MIEEHPFINTEPIRKRILFPVAVAVLIIFHIVGFWGLQFSRNPDYFQSLTPLNLILTSVLLFSFHKNWDKIFSLFVLTVALAGFVAEIVGIHTGLLFGDYVYGSALGVKLWQVPLLIGVNWLLLVYITGQIANYIGSSIWVKSFIGAQLMVLLDLFMEPVAIKFDFWQWAGNIIPLSNYIGWFGLAYILQIYYHRTPFYKENPLSVPVYIIQLFFFICLYMFI
jgi:uncharacterized membrane protein